MFDGVYEGHPSRPLGFHGLPPPDTGEVEWVVRRFARQLARLLERRGLGPDADPSSADLFPEDEPLLAALYSASVRGRIATGRRAGQRVLRLGDRIDSEDIDPAGQERCVNVAGVSLHANVYVPARDRKRLERLCRYAARPPVATKRLSRLPDGRLLYRLKHRWRDGSTHMVYEPMELLERLAALVPPPRAHQVRYHGILGPCASNRDRIAPGPRALPTIATSREAAVPAATRPASDCLPSIAATVDFAPEATLPASGSLDSLANGVPPDTRRPRRLSWAQLIQRVFAADVLQCPKCSGRLRILAAVHSPAAVQAILECLSLPSRAPPNAPARPEDPSNPRLPGFSDETAAPHTS